MPGLRVWVDAWPKSHRGIKKGNEGRPTAIVGIADRVSFRPTHKLESLHDPGVKRIFATLLGGLIAYGEALEECVFAVGIRFDGVECLLRSDTTQLGVNSGFRVAH